MGIIRKTPAVSLLLKEFQENPSALSVIYLTKRLKSKINKTTIYRVLDKLEDDGVLHSFIGNSGIKWYAKCHNCSKENHRDLHPHFQCQKCGRVDCLAVTIDLPTIPNRKITTSQILYQGICDVCYS